MDLREKRQRTSTACDRCHKRKLGCDPVRPCQLCIRAGVECIARHRSSKLSQTPRRASPKVRSKRPGNRTCADELAIFPQSNILDVSTSMFPNQSDGATTQCDTSALPGGSKPAASISETSIPWRDVVGVPLPSKYCLDLLLDCFFETVDWFMMVFHEEDFRRRYENLMISTYLPGLEDSNEPWLILLVVALGAHYSSLATNEDQERLDKEQVSKGLLEQVERRFLPILDSANEEAVQICVLLGSFYVFNGRPNPGLGILGSGVKIAQILRLHQEPQHARMTRVRLESRRRTWWALEVFDKYAAIAFGRPCSVDDSDCNVNTVSDLNITIDDAARQVTRLDYHRWKFRLYRIVGSFLSRRSQTNRLETVNRIHNQLVSWRTQLPHDLQLEKYKDGRQSASQVLQMQALALQLTYDNIQIVLHRSVVFGGGLETANLNDPPAAQQGPEISRNQLLQSAIRTSSLREYSRLLQACRKTHAVMHVGICLFTAGVVLCAFALSEPLSKTSEDAKKGIMNILHVQREQVWGKHLISTQSVKLLEDLVSLIMRNEQRFIQGEDTTSCSRVGLTAKEKRTPYLVSGMEGLASEGSEPGVSDQNQLEVQTDNSLQGSEPLENIRVGSELGSLSLDSTAGFVWNGENPYLFDPSLTDASQLWLWAESPDMQLFS